MTLSESHSSGDKISSLLFHVRVYSGLHCQVSLLVDTTSGSSVRSVRSVMPVVDLSRMQSHASRLVGSSVTSLSETLVAIHQLSNEMEQSLLKVISSLLV